MAPKPAFNAAQHAALKELLDAARPEAGDTEAVGPSIQELLGVLEEFKQNAENKEKVEALLAQLETCMCVP